MSRLTLGRVAEHPINRDYKLLDSFGVSGTDSSNIFFSNLRYHAILLQISDIQKATGGAGSFPVLTISTNGQTMETTNNYSWALSGWSATTAQIATGLSGQANIALTFTAGSLSSATSALGSDMKIWVFRPSATRSHIEFDWNFLNSASLPASARGHAFYASGPIMGVNFSLGAGAANNFNANVQVFGIGKY